DPRLLGAGAPPGSRRPPRRRRGTPELLAGPARHLRPHARHRRGQERARRRAREPRSSRRRQGDARGAPDRRGRLARDARARRGTPRPGPRRRARRGALAPGVCRSLRVRHDRRRRAAGPHAEGPRLGRARGRDERRAPLGRGPVRGRPARRRRSVVGERRPRDRQRRGAPRRDARLRPCRSRRTTWSGRREPHDTARGRGVPARRPRPAPERGDRARSHPGGGVMIRVLLADDETLIRDAVASLLGLEDDLEIVAVAASGTEAVAAASKYAPDVAVLDLQMPGLDGIEVAAELASSLPACGVVIVTSHGRPGYLKRALETGVRAFLPKTTSARVLADVVRQVHGGGRYVD